MALDGNEGEPEVYEDDWDNHDIPTNNDNDVTPTLAEGTEAVLKALDLFLDNKFGEALELMKPWAHCSIYHTLGNGTILFIQAVLTLNPDDISVAMESLKHGVILCNSRRKKGAFLYISRMIRGVDYNLYTDEEVHAELCYAECLLLMALLTFVADQGLVNFVKGGLRIRSCYQAYKECLQILENRVWEDEEQKRHYESGVRMGIGVFNLTISHLPSRITRLLAIIGFSGNREWGLQQLNDSVALTNTIRAPLGGLVLVIYHTIITYLFGICDGDVDHSEAILKELLKKYPEGALFLFFYGRVLQVKGRFDEAIPIFMKSINVQEEWKQVRNLSYWEVMWCHCMKFNWKEAVKGTDFLRQFCRWSPAIYTYAHALMLYQIMKEENRPEMMEEIVDFMKKVPGLKQRLAGKSFPAEKFVVCKAKKFLAQNNSLFCPTLELTYMWNHFPLFRDNPDTIHNIMNYVEEEGKHLLTNNKDISDDSVEDYCLVMLFKGMCYKYLGQYDKSEECFQEIIRLERRVETDTYLAPCATAEIGYLAMDQGNLEEAELWLENARHNYENYSMESFLHFRVHAALRKIRTTTSTTEECLTPSSIQSSPDLFANVGNGCSYSRSNSSPGFFSEDSKIYQTPVYKENTSLVS